MNKLLRILGRKGRITIPFEMRQHIGFTYNDVLSFSESPDGKSVLITREKICDDCKTYVCEEQKEDTDAAALTDFLDGLSQEQQYAALIHLSLKWAEKQGGERYGRT